MTKLRMILVLAAITLGSACGTGVQTHVTHAPTQDAEMTQMADACSHASIRQRLGSHGFEYHGATYFCGTSL